MIAIRGAITVENNDKKEILEASETLLKNIFFQNGIQSDDVVSIIFTCTNDLTSVYPAESARKLGLVHAALLCVQEMCVENSLCKCIRVMVNVEFEKSQKDARHIYMRRARTLRPDLAFFSVALDGPGGAGKSSVSKRLAKELGFVHVDTGAMYRAVAYYFIQKQLPLEKEMVCAELDNIEIDLKFIENDQKIFLNGVDVTFEIRMPEVSTGSSKVATYNEVRVKLVKMQQKIAMHTNVVMDGRDIGTAVLPFADVKIYLDAQVDFRAKRRVLELESKGVIVSLEDTKKEVMDRDLQDMSREFSPLVKAEDAIVVDTSEMTLEEVVNELLKIIRKQSR